MLDADSTSAVVDSDQPTSKASGYGSTAAGGSAWAILQVIVGKFVSLAGSVVLSWILVPADIGLAALALATLAFPLFLTPPLLSDLLIQRKDDANALEAAATRLARWSGWLGALVASAVAPLIAWIYSEPALLLLTPVATLRHIASSVGVSALARLRLQFRFREIARAGNVGVLVANASSIVLAATGLGPVAILVGQSLGTMTTGLGYRRLAPPQPGGDARRWRELLQPYIALSCGQWVHTLSVAAGTLCLGFVVSADVVGLFAFAFALSAQVNALLSYNVGIVLQPIFSHLQHDPRRQTQGFVRACAVMSAVAAPIALAQAAVARPLFACVFAPKWMDAAQAMSLLSIAQFFGFASGPTMALLKAQGRFVTLAIWQTAQTVVLVGLLLLLAWRYGLIGAAAAVALQSAIFGPLSIWLVIRGRGGSLATASLIFVRPLLVAAPIFAIAWFAAARSGSSKGLALAALLGLPLAGLVLFVAAYRIVDAATFNDARRILSGLWGRLRRVKQSKATNARSARS